MRKQFQPDERYSGIALWKNRKSRGILPGILQGSGIPAVIMPLLFVIGNAAAGPNMRQAPRQDYENSFQNAICKIKTFNKFVQSRADK